MMTISEAITSALDRQFHTNVTLRPKRNNVYQVVAPFYHEDGDMLDIYIQPSDTGLRICDFGKTLMRLSYTFELDTDNKLRIFNELLKENQVEFDPVAGNISFDTTEDQLCNSLLHFSQVIAKVSRLDVLRREIVSGLFFEMEESFISESLTEFNPVPHALPLPGRDELEVTCAFNIKPNPVYLFAVRNSSQARLATISFLEFQRAPLRFKGYVVHDDFDSLPNKDRKRITSGADKQFALDDFRENAKAVLTREAA
jgi:hypothetical protein